MVNAALAKRRKEEADAEIPPDDKSLVSLKLNDIAISYRESDGYVNATLLCKAGKKRFNHWNDLESTKDLIQALVLKTGIPAIKLLDSTKGRYGGSWLHPTLAIQLYMIYYFI